MTTRMEEPAALRHPPKATTTQEEDATGSPPESTRMADSAPLALARARGVCEGCGKRLDRTFDGSPEIHHRKLRSQGGKHDLINLLVLHRECHEWAHRHPKDARLHGWLVSAYFQPEDVPVVRINPKGRR